MHTPSDSNEFSPSDETVQQVTQQALQQYEGQLGNLLPILHAIQHALGCIPAPAVPLLAQALQRSRAEIQGVISFYPHFRETPAGPVVLQVCRAESCQAMGGNALAEHARASLGCDFHETTANGAVTLEPVYCLGLCAQSPAVMINDQPYARMTPEKLDRLLQAEGGMA
ncbi:formate dehydrogenase subunit gamma [Pollutimonas harenae]|uniref:Formate dehydrogenase subunit gamma n=1 Tax=Pollutimonas harenae TaxID=657015 RepID=A0A853H1L9_9BURK|nr:formate dehydrogenase subunit gamma [Pollutimonas harenae]NYT86856.1 formate dehydrogenase subunit gamma [Pollutimonas harenae]TEA69426.1 formate dehydrogenase subunit gamma [Pollutimonas harenae]